MVKMSTMSKLIAPEQRVIRDKCFHPTGTFLGFNIDQLEHSVVDRFERQVSAYPDRIAVKSMVHEWTYAELNKAANRLARAIEARQELGQTTIALLLEHGAPFITGMMASLKAARIVVPLDSSYPHARIASSLEDSQAGLILTDSQNFSLAGELAGHDIPLLSIESINPKLSAENIGKSISPDTLSHIVYTSGSTGQPKGVIQSHTNILHQAMTYTNALHICAEDRLTLLARVTGQAINTIFLALLNGASLFPLDVKTEGASPLANWFIGQEITIYTSSSPLFRNFMDTLTGVEEFPRLRVVRLASQTVSKKDVALYRSHFAQDCILVNGLSSSETGRVANYFIDKQASIDTPTVPVGYAAEDKKILLLDDDGEEVGFDQIGEIAVRSRYLSPGYWRRTDLTQAAYQPDHEGGGERIYRMGDMGRISPDGCIEHMGRKDFQVKVRGYRVEVAEIETKLLDFDGVKEAVVVPVEDASGNLRLVAYVVPAQESPLTVTSLRAALLEEMPIHMVPTAFVVMEALPQTPNGKVDRRALPPAPEQRPELEGEFIAPRDDVERQLTSIWEEVLEVRPVGVRDDFFELGGHSLLASQLFVQIRRVFGEIVPENTLLKAPTVEKLAQVISSHEWSPD